MVKNRKTCNLSCWLLWSPCSLSGSTRGDSWRASTLQQGRDMCKIFVHTEMWVVALNIILGIGYILRNIILQRFMVISCHWCINWLGVEIRLYQTMLCSYASPVPRWIYVFLGHSQELNGGYLIFTCLFYQHLDALQNRYVYQRVLSTSHTL